MSNALPLDGFIRLSGIIGNPKADPPIPAVIPVSKSTWWAGVKAGHYPQPVRTLGKRITAWRVEDIRALIQQAGIDVQGTQIPVSEKGDV